MRYELCILRCTPRVGSRQAAQNKLFGLHYCVISCEVERKYVLGSDWLTAVQFNYNNCAESADVIDNRIYLQNLAIHQL